MTAPIILVTGATRGIGFAAAKQLAARGVRVIIASRDLVRAKAAARKIGGTTEAISLDITDETSVCKAAEIIQHRHGHLDVLANNSGVPLDNDGTLATLSPQTLRDTLETNLIGTLRVTQALLPLLERSPAPRIINVSSGAGQLDGEPQAWAPAYSISKTALNMLTQQLTTALSRCMVNSMCPGWCRADMGGPGAPLSANEGADTLVWLALDAPHSLRGSFVKQRKVIPW